MNKLISLEELDDGETIELASKFNVDSFIATDDEREIATTIISCIGKKEIVILYGVKIARLAMKATKNIKIINRVPAAGFFPFRNGKCYFLAISDSVKFDKNVNGLYESLNKQIK